MRHCVSGMQRPYLHPSCRSGEIVPANDPQRGNFVHSVPLQKLRAKTVGAAAARGAGGGRGGGGRVARRETARLLSPFAALAQVGSSAPFCPTPLEGTGLPCISPNHILPSIVPFPCPYGLIAWLGILFWEYSGPPRPHQPPSPAHSPRALAPPRSWPLHLHSRALTKAPGSPPTVLPTQQREAQRLVRHRCSETSTRTAPRQN